MMRRRALFLYPSHDGKKRLGTFPSLTMPYLAGLMPDSENWDITIIDENRQSLPEEARWDAVFITVMTYNARHAYELAAGFRRSGSKVILGGWHPTACPAEAREHADAVVTGEAESVFTQLVRDLCNNELQPIYAGGVTEDMSGLPQPRWDLVDFLDFVPVPGARQINRVLKLFGKDISTAFLGPIQTRRGCVVNCSFCSVRGAVRARPPGEVADEVRQMMDRGVKYFFVVDDNLGLYPERTLEMVRAFPRGMRWGTQISVNFCADKRFLEEFRKAGCAFLFLGLESASPQSLKSVHKGTNTPALYKELIGNIREFGIVTMCSFILGLDFDQSGCGTQTAELARELQTEMAGFNRLYPLPGTPDYDSMLAEGRLLPGMERYWMAPNETGVVYQPRKLTPADLMSEVRDARELFYSYRWIAERIVSLPRSYHYPLLLLNLLLRGLHCGGEHMMADAFKVFRAMRTARA